MSKVVFVEDDALFVQMYQKKFSREGIEMIPAFDGKEGLQKIKENKPDLVFLDLMMPNMSGTELLKSLKKEPDFKETPVIVMTNLNSTSDEVSEAMKLGVKETILKTEVTPAEIVEIARKYLN